MKIQVLLVLTFSLLFSYCGQAQSGSNTTGKDSTEIIFNEIDHNFGTIVYQGNGTFEFEFKNTGKAPLILNHVQSTCGCTVPSYDTQPVAPKGKGKITVKYDTERVGPFVKTIMVFANTKNSPVSLTIRGEVKAKE
jgi:hypothetical protein